jgi:hypothetical protein
MLTPKFGGIFDCRKYDQSGKLAHDQRQLLAETDNIAFSAIVPADAVPEVFMVNGQLDEFARPKASKREREAAAAEGREPRLDVVAVKFKIGANARWFDASAQPMKRPTNAELEANRYQVQIDFTRKEKDPAQPLKPSGYWVNNIMISKIESNPFVGQAFEQAAAAVAETLADPDEQQNDDDGLPFD